ncbi:MAG: potassium channel family protein [Actinomycetota bacterium]
MPAHTLQMAREGRSNARVHVIVVGCGRVGSELAAELAAGGHSVAVVDKNASAFRRLPAGFQRTVTGIGFDRDTLIEAGVEEASAFAAVTSGDNSNILSVRVAREVFGIAKVVARIYDPRRALIYQRLGINTVATVTWTTQQVLRRLMPETTATDWTDPSGKVTLVERTLPGVWAGHSLARLDDGDRFRLVAVARGGECRLATPSLIGQEGDILHLAIVAGARDALDARLDAGPEEVA